jgi:hypothetical protein
MGPIVSVYVDYTSNTNQAGSISVKQVTSRKQLVHVGPSSSPLYDTYSASFPTGENTNQGIITFDVAAVIAGETYASLNNAQISAPC